MAQIAEDKARLLSTTEWIRRAKEDPAQWIHSHTQPLLQAHSQAIQEGIARPQDDASTNDLFRMPSHLIFSRLPVGQLFQLRCVCKVWNSVLKDPFCSIICAGVEQQEEHWFVMSHPLPYGMRLWDFKGFSSLYHTDTPFCLPLPSSSHARLSSLLGGMHCSLLPRLERPPCAGCCRPRIVSAGGLMCAFVHRPDALDDYSVIVFNCLTGSVRVLPPCLDSSYLSKGSHDDGLVGCKVYMSVDMQDSSRYYVMLTHQGAVVSTYPGSSYFEIFDSMRGSWRVACDMDSATFANSSSEVFHGDFFFLAYSALSESTLLGYHAARDLWGKVSLPTKESRDTRWECLDPIFLKHKGRLLQALPLLQAPGQDADGILLGFIVSELQFVSSKPAAWVEVARTPHHLWQGLPCMYWWHRIMAEGDIFCMTFQEAFSEGQHIAPLVYDIARDFWYVLPGSTDLGCILVHRPKLSMLAPCLEVEDET
ncbi:hypothetical protein GOP47_0008968 [Adiantum capillus-veneris]|uniref:F-box domain-containing protein n=1 Tax=Adiantum capillus-veneris TaxID=13818 RepID=A0A9D4UZJ6_ADICA|nr:hypothetical protein GOP47_0008968 [Adiantum capillus-veneris]